MTQHTRVPHDVGIYLYSTAAALIDTALDAPQRLSAIEAAACGCPLVLGPYFHVHMRHRFGEFGDAVLWARSVDELHESVVRVYHRRVPPPESFVGLARAYSEAAYCFRGWGGGSSSSGGARGAGGREEEGEPWHDQVQEQERKGQGEQRQAEGGEEAQALAGDGSGWPDVALHVLAAVLVGPFRQVTALLA